MAVDKLVDSTQLDSDLTSVANAIRAKSGGSGQLAFPSGFVSEIQAIPSGGGGGGLPSGFTRLLYLQATGTQIIDTGKYAKQNSKVECDYCWDAVNESNYAFVAGCGNPQVTVGASRYKTAYPTVPNTGGTLFGFGSASDQTLSPNVPQWCRGIGSVSSSLISFTLKYGNGISQNSISATLTENQASHLCIFGRGSNGTYERFAHCKVYEYWLYEGDTLVQHMLPAKRDSDSVLGMYDVVNDVFYQNAGTGTFVGGAME